MANLAEPAPSNGGWGAAQFCRRRLHHSALLVDDVYEAKDELSTKGITEFKGTSPRPDGLMQLVFHDPDGYMIEVYSLPS